MIAESPDAFLADFGVTLRAGARSVQVIFDIEGADILGDRVNSTKYTIKYVTAELPNLKHGDPVTIKNVQYEVKTPLPLDDGVFSTATVQKT